jgi:hypothetical protein
MGHARPSRRKEGTAWKSKPMVCPINQNDLDWRLAKSFSGSQTTEAPTNNHHAGYARVWDFSFADRDTISVSHCSVMFSHLFLKRLTVEISENLRASRALLT